MWDKWYSWSKLLPSFSITDFIHYRSIFWLATFAFLVFFFTYFLFLLNYSPSPSSSSSSRPFLIKSSYCPSRYTASGALGFNTVKICLLPRVNKLSLGNWHISHNFLDCSLLKNETIFPNESILAYFNDWNKDASSSYSFFYDLNGV